MAGLDTLQLTSARWADHPRRNGLKPEIRAEASTPGRAFEMLKQTDVLVIDTPAWTDRETLFLARWATFCVIPSQANRMDDLAETVRLLHRLTRAGFASYRYGVALNALRESTAAEDDRDAREYLAEAGYPALPGYVRDLKAYEIALLEGKAITETDDAALNSEASVLVDGIAGAVHEAARQLLREAEAMRERERGTDKERGR